jgi:hypothetical protein
VLGSGLPVTGFPEFEQFCIQGFPGSTQVFKSLASTNFATPADADLLPWRTSRAKNLLRRQAERFIQRSQRGRPAQFLQYESNQRS